MPTFTDHVDFSKSEARNFVGHKLASAPSSPVAGQRYYDTTLNKEGVYNGSSWDYAGSGSVTSVAATSPITSTGGTTPTIAIVPASGITAGSMSIPDFNKLGAATAVNTASTIVLRDGSGNVALGVVTSSRVTGLSAPQSGSDAVNRDYADALAATGNNKGEARVIATGNIAVASPGATIDGVPLSSSTPDLVLLIGQTTASQNGLYVFNGAASPLTRATNADTTAEVKPGMFVFVTEGSVNNASNGYTLVTPNPIVLGTTALTFVQTSGAGQITAGTGLTKSGNVLNVGAGPGILANADDVAIDTSVVARKYPQLIGDGTTTAITVTHGLNNLAPTWSCVLVASPYTHVTPSVASPTANTTTFTFGVAPMTNQYRVTLVG